MKVYSLYYKDQFVVSFPTREDCVEFGKKHYQEYCWDCYIIQEYLNKTPYQMYVPPTIPTKNPFNTGITIDPTKPSHVNYWIGTKAEVAQGHFRKDLDVI